MPAAAASAAANCISASGCGLAIRPGPAYQMMKPIHADASRNAVAPNILPHGPGGASYWLSSSGSLRFLDRRTSVDADSLRDRRRGEIHVAHAQVYDR